VREFPDAAETEPREMFRPLGRLRPGTTRRDEAAGTQVDELERLASLHEKGVLTDEELAAGKARILGAS